MPHQTVHVPPDLEFLAGFERIREQFDVPESFPDEVLAAAQTTVPEDHERIDRRDLDLVAIDPPGSADLDQAYAAEPRGEGYRVFYAIADVAPFVPPGGPVDLEARERGVTRYHPDGRTPLYPAAISEGAASLLAGKDRPALLWTVDLGGDGRLETAEIRRALVRVRRQLTYRQAQDEIDAGDGLGLLREIGERRIALEAERGGVHLNLPDQEVVPTGDGRYAVVYERTLPVERWNAQVSLLTGMAAADLMIEAGVGILRTLPDPEPGTVDTLRRTADALGIEWAEDTGYAERIRRLHPDTAAEAALLGQAVRLLRGAGYEAFDGSPSDDARHSAVAAHYAHVTAPLRRLADRFANEVLLAHCAGEAPPAWATEALDGLPRIMNRTRSQAGNLERAYVDYVEAMALRSRVGERFRAVVTDVDGDRARVQLRDPAVIARLPAGNLGLGEEVEVLLDEVDPDARRVHFSIA
ncbi:MAG: RNB domain-containing ribonuclease [Acidimicrobiia bacterium]|nr:RNB domain-containing ribonuclease [Acidimicrobiia bacterium]